MSSSRNICEILSLHEFKNLVKNNQLYTGLVEGLGWVYWTDQELLFEYINSHERFATPVYVHIFFTVGAKSRGNPIVSRIVHHLNLMPPWDLQQRYPDAYRAYYERDEDRGEGLPPIDALRVAKPRWVDPSILYHINKGGDGLNPWLKLGADVDEAVGGAIGLAEMLTKNGALGEVGGILSILSIAHSMDKGEYWNAGFNGVLFVVGLVNPYVSAFSLLKGLMQSDAAHEGMARQYAKQYKTLQAEYYRISRKNPNDSKLYDLKKRMQQQKGLFESEIKKLGIKY
jgi:hypothetical protein